MNSIVKRQTGVGLIEVLVAIVIVAFVTLAVMRLQTAVIKSGSDAKARSVAVALAQQKRDDLLSFKCLQDLDDSTTLGASDCPKTDPDGTPSSGDEELPALYVDIASSTGGAIVQTTGNGQTRGNLEIPPGQITIGNVDYDLSWTVQDHYYCGGNAAPIQANPGQPNCTPGKGRPDFKTVEVTVEWYDETMDANDPNVDPLSVTIEGVIPAADPLGVAELEQGNAGTAEAPDIAYTPEAAPDVVAVPVSIDVAGAGVYKETSKPLPTVTQSGDNVTTTFSVVTYDKTSANANTGTLLSNEEFATINCECEFNGSNNKGWSPSRAFLNEDGDGLTNELGEYVTKVTGVPDTANNVTQPALCDECCRDHHDADLDSDSSVDSSESYDPWRFSPFVASSYTRAAGSGNHKHYYTDDKGTGNKTDDELAEVDEAASTVYHEACRFRRINGILRLTQDWWLTETVTMPRDFLTTSTNLDAYVDWVIDRLEYEVAERLEIAGLASHSLSKPAPPSGRDFLLLVPGAKAQGLSRSLYLDYMDNDQLAAVQAKLNNINNTSDNDSDWLSLVPFYEINTTLLSLWKSKPDQACTSVGGTIEAATGDCIDPSLPTSNPNRVIFDEDPFITVTNDEVDTITNTTADYYGEYSRGLTDVEPTVASTLTTASATYTAITRSMLRRSNSGLTPLLGNDKNTIIDPEDILLAEAIDPQDQDDTLLSDISDVVSPGQAVSGIFLATGVPSNRKNTLSDIVVSGIPSGSSECNNPGGNDYVTTNPNSFCFDAPAATTGTLTFSIPTESGFSFCLDPDGDLSGTTASVPFDTDDTDGDGEFIASSVLTTLADGSKELIVYVVYTPLTCSALPTP